MNKIESLFIGAVVPLSLLNIFGGVVSGVWLAILGEWGVIGTGVLALFVSGMALGLAMMPGLIFSLPAAAMLERGNKIGGYIFTFLSLIYTYGLLIVWSVVVLIHFTDQATDSSLIPILIWSYGVATGPISFLASKDAQSGSDSSALPTLLLQVAYLAVILGIIFVEQMSFFNVICTFVLVMSIGLLSQLLETVQLYSDQGE
jgi:hypothetical protein